MKFRFKNLISLFLILLLSFSLFSCNKSNNELEENPNSVRVSYSFKEFLKATDDGKFKELERAYPKDSFLVPYIDSNDVKVDEVIVEDDIRYMYNLSFKDTKYLAVVENQTTRSMLIDENGVRSVPKTKEEADLKAPQSNHIEITKDIDLHYKSIWTLDFSNAKIRIFVAHKTKSKNDENEAKADKVLLENLKKTKLEFKRYGDVRGSDFPIYK